MEWSFVNICTVAGTLISLLGFVLTLWQLFSLKKTTRESQQRIEAEVTSAQQKIKNGLAINNVVNVSKNLGEAIDHINQGKFELASQRLEDIEPALEEILNDEKFGLASSKSKQFLKDFREVMTSMITNANQTNKINSNHVLTILTNIRTVLVQINASLKRSLYEPAKN